MARTKIDQMDTDDLWALHGEVTPVATKLPIGKARSEARLKQLAVPVLGHRPYPAVLPNTTIPIYRHKRGQDMASSRAGSARS